MVAPAALMVRAAGTNTDHETVKACEFKVFTDWANNAEGRVAALRLPGGGSLSRKQIDDCAAHAAKHGAKGLAWMRVDDLAKGRAISESWTRENQPWG